MSAPAMVDYQFVTERLAIGGAIGTLENMREIAQAGITHVVNMQKEFDDSLLTDGTGIAVLWAGCEDDFLPKPAELFWKGVRFTLEALVDPDAKVLFHCAAGVHRSPFMLLAVLRVLGHERRAAMDLISIARPQANFPPIYIMSVEDFFREYCATLQSN
jgi:protein-tyrosine phosphatase